MRALLAGAIDYAGLFPPAALAMETAVANYARYRGGGDAWALGRFLVPGARLGEFDAVLSSTPNRGDVWPVGLIGVASAGVIEDFNGRSAGRARIGAVEAAVPLVSVAGLTCYGEVALGQGLAQRLDALQAAGIRAKVRTGGLQPGAIPEAAALAEFLTECHRRKLPYKATAGLHHAVRGVHTLDDRPTGAPARMHGFLNLLAASAVLAGGGDAAAACQAIEAGGPEAFCLSSAQAARRLFIGWGSCSFEIPLDELRALGWLAE